MTDVVGKGGLPENSGPLLAAVNELTKVTKALTTVLEKDYPKRTEIARDYATRREVKARRRWVITGTVAALVGSYFGTVGTVSFCFLDGIPMEGEKNFCRVFPGYDETFNNNRRAVDIHEIQQKQIEDLRKRVDLLEAP